MTPPSPANGFQLVVGSAGGLHGVDDGRTRFEGRTVTAMSGPWALLDGRTVVQGATVVTEMEGPAGACILDLGEGALLGTAGAHLVRVPGGQVASFDDAPDRDRWYTPWGGPPDVRSLAVGPDGTLFANVHVGGILRSVDGGDSWHPTLDIDLDVHQVVVADDGTVVAATAFGLALSVDGGATFAVQADGLHATYARAVAVAGDTLLLSVSTGPDGRGSALYRRPLHGGGAFRRTTVGLPGRFPGNIDTFCLVAQGRHAALGTAAGRVYASEDAGATWSTVAAGPPVTCLALTS